MSGVAKPFDRATNTIIVARPEEPTRSQMIVIGLRIAGNKTTPDHRWRVTRSQEMVTGAAEYISAHSSGPGAKGPCVHSPRMLAGRPE